jgi:hypothetical protein
MKRDDLAKEIYKNRTTGEVARSVLKVDERVLARVTDGIYRRPSSAFRELICNAYDADATQVIIRTDAPRFERVIIRDNGSGMNPEAVADLIHHIGGSSKRTQRGKQLQTVNTNDPSLSPGGRRLIGKIGIGLFSVAQLTQHFQIITKRKGDAYRTSADVVLRTHTEELLHVAADQFETGEVAIISEPAEDKESHGTEIILMDLRVQAKDLLRSADRWEAIAATDEAESTAIKEPSFHIGRSEPGSPDVYLLTPNLPWDPTDSPEDKFRKLYNSVRQEVRTRKATPNIEESLDNYLGMMWILSLATPVRYIYRHPFDLTDADGIGFFKLTQNKGGPEEINLANNETIGQKLRLASAKDPVGEFQVILDDVELMRPVSFDSELHGNSGIGRPLMFFASIETKLGSVAPSIGGGSLAFEAYFYWNQKITPKENNGCLIRINNASGVLFDKTFLDYQVSELTRLRQIMSEVFITEGLDAALNIDRESFNYSHPHYQYIQKWVHFAVRQVTNRLKSLNKEQHTSRKEGMAAARLGAVETLVNTVWQKRFGSDAETPPSVSLVSSAQEKLALSARERGEIIINEERVFDSSSLGKTPETAAQAIALTQILAAYGLLDNLSYSEQESLVADVLAIFLVK